MAEPFKPLNSPFGNRPDKLEGPVPMKPQDAIPNTEGFNVQSLIPQELGGQAPDILGQPQEQPQNQSQEQIPQELNPIISEEQQPQDLSQLDIGSLSDDELAKILAPDQPSSAQNQEEEILQQPDFLSANFTLNGIKEQANEALARIKNSFASTGPEAVKALKEMKIFDDVKLGSDGEVLVKRKGKNAFEPLDRDTVELIGDTLDFSRDALEAVVDTGARAGIGAAASVVGSPVGGVVAAAGSGAVTAAVAKNAGDLVAEKLLGIEREASRKGVDQRVKETAKAAAFGAGFGALGKFIGNRLLARRRAQKAVGEALEEAANRVSEAADDVKTVLDSGIVLDKDRGVFRVDPQQAIGKGTIPEIDEFAKELSKNQAFRNFREKQGEALVNAYKNLVEKVGSKARGARALGKEFVLNSNDVRLVEGKTIERFRALADKKLMNQPQEVPNLLNALREQLDKAGVKFSAIRNPKTGGIQRLNIEFPGDSEFNEIFKFLTPAQSKALKKELQDLTDLAFKRKGKLTVNKIHQKYLRLTEDINKAFKTGNSAYAVELTKLRDALREDWIDSIGRALGPEDQKAYLNSVKRYRDLINAQKTLGKLLEEENISKEALTSKLFSNKSSLKLIRSTKTLLKEFNPKLLQDLQASYLDDLLKSNIDPKTGAVNWSALARKWRSLGPEMHKEILDGTGFTPSLMEKIIKIGNKFDNAKFPFKPNGEQLNLLGNLWLLLQNTFLTTKVHIAKNIVRGLGKDDAVAIWLKDGGLEEIIDKIPNFKRETSAMRFMNAVAESLEKGVLKTEARRQIEKFENR